jgi:hypothetical protein
MDVKEIGWGRVEWIQLAQDRDRWRSLLNTLMNIRVMAPRSLFFYVLYSLLRKAAKRIPRW